MTALVAFFRKSAHLLSFIKRERKPARFRFDAVFDPEELDHPELLPTEFQYALRKADIKNDLKKVLGTEGGDKGIAIRTTIKTPEHVLRAVNNIAVLTQHRCITTWLPQLIRNGTRPVFTEADHEQAQKSGIELHQEIATIIREASRFKRFAIIDEENRGITGEEHDTLDRLNSITLPYHVEYAVNRIVFDNAHERTEVAQTIIKVLIVVGPVTHALEKFAHGVGKVFAASVDDVMSEAAELMALRGSGFSWAELTRRSKILVPVFALATYGVLNVESLIEQERYLLGGAIFGLSAVALSLTTAIQSVRMYLHAVQQLVAEKKLVIDAKPTKLRRAIFWEAVRQDFTNPARLGLFVGALASPLVSMTVFGFFPRILHNGWVLAALGSTETIIAGSTVYLARYLNDVMFKKKIKRAIASLPIRA